MMKKVVEENRDRRAIVSCDGTIDWNYGQYYQEVQKAAKGFISLGMYFVTKASIRFSQGRASEAPPWFSLH